MKNGFKKLGGLILALALTLSLSVPSFAAESLSVDQSELRGAVVEIVANATSKEEREKMLSELLEETPLAPYPTMQATYSPESISITGMPEVVETVVIDENKRVDFFETGDFGILEMENLGETNVAVPYATYKYTDTYRTSYTIENVFGGKIVETYVKGYFRYDGTNTPTAYLEDAGYSKGTLIFWDCSSWDADTGRNFRDKTAYCYADAYYDWTLDISLGGSVGGDLGGVEGEVSGEVSDGLTIQDCNVYLRLICSKTGYVSGRVSLEG